MQHCTGTQWQWVHCSRWSGSFPCSRSALLLHAPVQAPSSAAGEPPSSTSRHSSTVSRRGFGHAASTITRRRAAGARPRSSGGDLRLRLLPTPRRSEDRLDPGSSARLTDAAEAEGSSIIHLHEDTWRLRGNIVRDRLLNRVQATQRVFARKTKARPIAAEEAIAFLDDHHLWGPTNAKYAYGLFLQDELVAVATFTKRKLVKRRSGKAADARAPAVLRAAGYAGRRRHHEAPIGLPEGQGRR